ncbi:PEP-CTERM sorting domain-containing protein [Horticoccus luteus]|uniref:PEP-CTERM sorting domain-containing protein n=1 Tax=Horticoccus luteus TaxID=2862869 RepID=A0A8F9TSR4_9BACT|nr:PEP-CTERM sorting domain-containing protein [Horticoccus luteus]QYM77608.1 PEP-CTERM sorting domain-containing protein [Horticoccus luteus]
MNSRFLSLFRRSALLALLPLLAIAARAQTVTISFGAGTLYDGSGTMVPAGALVLLVADTNQDDFAAFTAGSSLAVGSYLNGDDQILGRAFTDSDATVAASFASIPLASNPSPGAFTALTTGDRLALVWFPQLDASTLFLSNGDAYGLFSSLSTTADGDPWTVPGAGGTIMINFLTLSVGGEHPETDGHAPLAAIPEPATFTLGLGGIVLLGAALRRFSRQRSAAR